MSEWSEVLIHVRAAGINFASLLLDCVEGKSVRDLRGAHKAGVTMVRYWSEVFETSDGAAWRGTALEDMTRTPAGSIGATSR